MAESMKEIDNNLLSALIFEMDPHLIFIIIPNSNRPVNMVLLTINGQFLGPTTSRHAGETIQKS